MIWNREEYISHMNFEFTGKEFFTELFGPLVGLEKEWKKQGASDAECALSAFGFDRVQHAAVLCNLGVVNDLKTVILEETPQYTLSVDRLGRTQKLIKESATIPLPLNYPVKSMEDWLKIKHWYTFDECRVDRTALLQLKKRQDKGCLTVAYALGGFDEPRELMGEENLCVAYYEQPELIDDMLQTFAETALKAFERVTDILTVDNLSIHEDLAGKSGPLAGPLQVKRFIQPYYQKIIAPLRAHGTRIVSQDSDGNINAVIEDFLDAGVTVLYPFEPGSGMDMVEARKKYGKRLAIKGGLNKYALMSSKSEILKELSYKICADTTGGGTVFALDHRIPNGVPIDYYRYYVNTARDMLNLPPIQECDFVQMAF